MIFSGDLYDKVLDGTKTVTRRVGVMAPKYKPGRTYSIQKKRAGKGHEEYRILVLSNKCQKLGSCARNEEWIKEGFVTYDEFSSTWRRLNGSFDPKQEVQRIEFELVPG